MLTYSSVGVIYGDIGTSPLYTYASIFSFFTPTEDQIIGATSLILWGLTLIVMIKYCCESPSLDGAVILQTHKSPPLFMVQSLYIATKLPQSSVAVIL